MMMQRTVFISHAHADNVLCEQIAQNLRQQGIDVWIDLHDAQIGADLSEDIMQQLERRTVFVLMVTAASNDSRWVRMERDVYIHLANDKDTHLRDGVERLIVPVRLEPVTPPTTVLHLRWIDGVGKNAEQVAREVAAALGMSGNAALPLSYPPMQQFYIPTRLVRLGFVSAVIKGVEVIVPPVCDVQTGTFIMGSDRQHDSQANDDEIPPYTIFVPTFQIGVYPVTVAEYACAVNAGAVNAPVTVGNVTWQIQQQRMEHPVVGTTWLDACAYAAWVAKVTGQLWRLPTEAEWEKAARGIDRRIYPWGTRWDATRANTYEAGLTATTPIGNYAEQGDASPYGAHDLAGNVWEWTSSIYIERYPYRHDQAEKDATTTTALRVLRGGSWRSYLKYARTTERLSYAPVNPAYNVGMRLARGAMADA